MQGASDYINTISPEILGSVSYDSDPVQAVNNYLTSSIGDINKVNEAVAASSDGAPNLQRLASLLQVNLSPSNMTSPYVDVLKTQQMRLAEQPIYGSSRVGVSSYWPGQYDAVWDFTTGTQDTLRLLGLKPWYNTTLDGYQDAGSTNAYAPSLLNSASAAHVLGQKQYELSSHLGNVQATVSDKRYVQKQYLSTTDSLRKGFAVAVRALYDYYPFGMPMKERSTSDTATQSVYMSQVVYSPQYTKVNNAMSGASITSLNTTASTNYNGSVNYTGQSASISKVLSSLLPNVPVQMKIDLLYTNKPLYLAIQQGSTASPSVYTNLLYSTTMNSSGTYTISFTPTQSSVQLSIAYSYFNTNANTLCFTLDSVNYQQQSASVSSTQLVQVSNKINDGYRYSYNTQEKVDEIAGAGNHTTALFWEYDTRLGRRWNLDPKPIAGISNYVCLANNPIALTDPLGDVVKPTGDKKDVKKFIKQLNKTTGNKYAIDKNGELYNKTGVTNTETTKKKSGELSGLVKSAIEDKEVFTLDLVNNDAGVLIDNYQSGKVDVGDFAKMDRVTQAGQFTHFLTERMENPGDYSPANKTDPNFKISHDKAFEGESRVVASMLKIPFAKAVQTDVVKNWTDATGETHYYFEARTAYGSTVYGFNYDANLVPAGGGKYKVEITGTFLSKYKKIK